MLLRRVEHVYLTDFGGTPIVQLSRPTASKTDPDLIASMFTALQNFMDDSFRMMGAGAVKSIEMGKRHHIAFARGRWSLLYVVYRGRESNRLEARIEALVREIEAQYGDLLRTWNGDVAKVSQLRGRLATAWRMPTGARTREASTTVPP